MNVCDWRISTRQAFGKFSVDRVYKGQLEVNSAEVRWTAVLDFLTVGTMYFGLNIF